MADAQSIITLNIGSQTVSLAQFALNKQGGLTVIKYGKSEILADPSVEVARLPQVRLAISQLAEQLKIGKGQLRYAVSGQSVFVRFIKLPPVGEEDVAKLVRFEAQQHVPFPIDEVAWDYHLLPDTGGEQEVALVAIKSDALNEVNDLVQEAGIHSSSGVEVAPLALYNAYTNSYPNEEGSIVLADIGARTMNLIYIEGSKVFVRSIPGGGAALTTALAKEFGLSFAEAEAQKVQNGMVALGGGHTSTLDEGTAAIATVLRNALNRIVSEIPRTTGFFRSQHGGSAPTKLVLCGGTASLPYCKEFIEEKLRIPVEFFNPLGNIAVSKNMDSSELAASSHMTGELVGMALAAFGKARVDIELVPDAIEKERDSKRRLPLVIGGCAAAVIGAGIFAFGANKEALEIEKKVSDLNQRKAILEKYEGQANALNFQVQQLDEISGQYAAAQGQRVFWVDLLADVAARTKTDVLWIVDFDPLVGHDPSGKEVALGTSYYIEKLGTLKYGQSMVIPELPKLESTTPTFPGMVQEPEDPKINAIRLQGLFINTAGPNTVKTLVKQLAESPYFDLKDDKGQLLEEGKLITKLDPNASADEFASPFTLILPLKDPVEVPPVK